MFEARFENQYGFIRFGGGSGAMFRTIDIAGLGPPKKEYNTMSYSGQPGEELISEKDIARTITIVGDVVANKALQHELGRMAKILYRPGVLTILSGNKRRAIACRCVDFDEPERHGKSIARVVLQFSCDNPYFADCEEKKISLFYREPLLKTEFTLPCAFSSRISRRTVVNSGDVKTEPVFTIYNSSSSATLDESYGIEIVNYTTNQSILIEHNTAAGEIITIDIPGRKVVSSVDGDITHLLSEDSFLSDFWLCEGKNDIEAVNYNEGEDISIVMKYNNKYIEAVY